MGGGIFVMTDQNTLVPMQPTPFAKEADFQKLLADFAALLSGDDDRGRWRWLLVARETAIRDGAAADPTAVSGRWSLDHLFLDQEGIPTLVEVKRQSDTRLRREVVGQMLDYAANGVAYWSAEELRRVFEERCAREGRDSEDEVRSCLGLDEPETLWQQVKTNLQAGRIRLLFVADEIPPELRRIVEFLNEQMDPAEVLAIELRHYTGQGLKTIVPSVIGQTQEAQTRKGGQRLLRQWDEEAIYQAIETRFGAEQAAAARKIGAWLKAHAERLWFGRGATTGSMIAVFQSAGREVFPFALWTSGKLEIAFRWMQKPPFDDRAKRLELLRRLNLIAGVSLPESVLNARPAIALPLLIQETALTQLFDAMAWFAAQLRAA